MDTSCGEADGRFKTLLKKGGCFMLMQGRILNDEYALVLTLRRNDLVQAGLPESLKSQISDSDLDAIADELGDALLSTAYWDCLRTIIDEMGLNKKD